MDYSSKKDKMLQQKLK